MTTSAIELAYEAHGYVSSDAYRHGRRRKMYNPIRTTPALVQAMTHLGRKEMGLAKARDRARRAVHEPKAQEHIGRLDWDGLLGFLDTIAVFLKAGPQGRKERGMRKFNPKDKKERLTNQEISQEAQDLVDKIAGPVTPNKLKKMGAHATAARDPWEALAGLARFYPRSGIPKRYVDALVELLETADLHSFKQVVAQSLIFYEAGLIKSRR